MNRKTVAIIIEIIPVLSAAASFMLIFSDHHSELVKQVILITMVLAFGGFLFFLAGRKIAREDKLVRILGVLDLLATICVVGLYILAIFSFGL